MQAGLSWWVELAHSRGLICRGLPVGKRRT